MMNRLFLGFFLILLSGCSSLKSAPNQLVVDKRWVRNTVNMDYLGARRIHRFEPILLDKMVIVGNSIDGVVAYDRQSANTIWRLPLKGGSEGGGEVVDGLLYFGASDGQMYAVQVDTGRVVWTYPLKAEGLARPHIQDGVLYVLGGNSVAHAIEAKTGKLIWQYNRREAGNISVRGGSQPVVSGNIVLFGFSDGALVGLNKSSGTILWETSLSRNLRFRDVDASPVLDGDRVYVSSYDGSLNAVAVADGNIIWTIENGGYEEVLSSGTSLFFSSTDGKTMAIEKATGRVIWSKTNPLGIATGPVILKGVVMVGEMLGGLRFYDARTGDNLGVFEPGRGVTSRATVDKKNGDVYFLSHDANLFALKLDWERHTQDWPWQ